MPDFGALTYGRKWGKRQRQQNQHIRESLGPSGPDDAGQTVCEALRNRSTLQILATLYLPYWSNIIETKTHRQRANDGPLSF